MTITATTPLPIARAPSTDEVLATAARDGSSSAFEELVRRYQVPLLRFLQRRGPSPSEAEDVLQETFVRAYRSMGSYRSDRPFKPWLFTIGYRLAIDAARRQPGPTLAVTDDATGDGRPGPHARAADAEAAVQLWDTVRGALGEDPFTAVWLHYADGLPPREVASVMGRSQVWVRTTLHRARRRLADVLGPEHRSTT